MERCRARGIAGLFVFALASSGCIEDPTDTDSQMPNTAGENDPGTGTDGVDDDDDDDRPGDDDDDAPGDDDDDTPGDDDDDDDDASPGDCCSASTEAGCAIDSVAECVCEASAFCCTIAWDAECVEIANNDCGGCEGNGDDDDDDDDTPGDDDDDDDGPVGGDCCVESETPGCADKELEACVCGLDDFCCNMAWDIYCVEAAAECGGGCDVGPGPDPEPDCCVAGDIGQCDDEAITTCVCEIDAACCDEAWDASCVVTSIESCSNTCPDYDVEGMGDCCEPNGTPGCTDATIQLCTCAQDPFCCTDEWDDLCVEGSALACDSGCEIPEDGGGSGDGGA